MSYGFLYKKEKNDEFEADEEFFSVAVEEAKKQINFDEIHDIMTLLKWTYNNGTVPTKETLISTVDYLFKEAMKELILYNEDVSVSTGGFEVVLRKNGELEILFILKNVIITKED